MSRSELLKQAQELGEKLNREITVDERATANQVGKLVEELELEVQIADEERAKREKEIEAEAAARKLAALNANRDEFKGRMKFEHEVAPKKTIKCRFGVLQPGAEVRPEYVGGAAELAKLVKARAVLRAAKS